MARFLHISDIHLGFDRYNNKERTKDFYFALANVLDRYAIQAEVDFVIICGDLFEQRMIQPAVLNQAQLCLQAVKDAGIPVLAIEGNHDNCPYGTTTSWLKYLSQWGLLKLLEPSTDADGGFDYSPWDDESRSGGYIDLCGVRVLGSNWYGAAAPQAIQKIAEAVATLPPGPDNTLLMFHHGLEGQIARYSGALRYQELLPLKEVGVDYLALGHIHKAYSEEGWVFNPGSLEANNIEEGSFERGAYLVEINAEVVQAELKQDYQQRPMVRLIVKAQGDESQEELVEAAIAKINGAIAKKQLVPAEAPIVELRIQGNVGFERLSLDTKQLQQELQTLSQALIFLLKYDVEETAYQSPTAEDASRDEIERNAFLDLLTGHRDYKKRADALAQGLVDLKERQLLGEGEEVLYPFIEALIQGEPVEAVTEPAAEPAGDAT
ncbi:MAG: exonuclease SbcCD subunit D [Leptolyngbyaceae cyanobacterium]